MTPTSIAAIHWARFSLTCAVIASSSASRSADWTWPASPSSWQTPPETAWTSKSRELAQLLWSETEGNPFFVQEILLSLVESGRLVQRDGVWTTDLEIAELGIPEGVREVVGRRLSRLSEAANTVLSIASVVGQAMDVDVLVAVSALPEDAVIDALDEASSAALLRESASGTYEFTHALVRSTLYDELSATRRTRRHRQIGEFLEVHPLVTWPRSPITFAVPAPRIVELSTMPRWRRNGRSNNVRLTRRPPSSAKPSRSPKTSTNRGRRGASMIRLGAAQRMAAQPQYRETLLHAAELWLPSSAMPICSQRRR